MTWRMGINRLLTQRRLRYAWITGGALWGAWLLSTLLGPGNLDLANQVVGTDYIQFYAAGLTIRMGESPKLYDFGFQSQLEQTIAGPNLTHFHAFITPPFLAWLYAPLTFLPYLSSFTLWSLLGLVMLWLSLFWLGLKNPWRPFTWAMTWFPIFAAISFGQNSLLSLALLCATYALWRQERYLAAGLVCSLCLYKPQLILGVGLLWLLEWKRDWKALLGLALGGATIASLSFLLLPEASWAYVECFREILPSLIHGEQFPLYHLHALRGFWTLLLPSHTTLVEVLALLFSIGGIIVFIRFWLANRDHQAILFSGAICLTIWITPHAMIYDWALLLIPGVLLWKHFPQLREDWQAFFALTWIVTFLSGPLTYAQLSIMPIAIQISVPVFIFTLISAQKVLTQRTLI